MLTRDVTFHTEALLSHFAVYRQITILPMPKWHPWGHTQPYSPFFNTALAACPKQSLCNIIFFIFSPACPERCDRNESNNWEVRLIAIVLVLVHKSTASIFFLVNCEALRRTCHNAKHLCEKAPVRLAISWLHGNSPSHQWQLLCAPFPISFFVSLVERFILKLVMAPIIVTGILGNVNAGSPVGSFRQLAIQTMLGGMTSLPANADVM